MPADGGGGTGLLGGGGGDGADEWVVGGGHVDGGGDFLLGRGGQFLLVYLQFLQRARLVVGLLAGSCVLRPENCFE